MVSIFVDANAAAASHGEKGAEIATGPRVGPETLERVLCEGRVQVIALDRQKPVASTLAARPIPAATRRFVLWRDSGCVVDGCSSATDLNLTTSRHLPKAEITTGKIWRPCVGSTITSWFTAVDTASTPTAHRNAANSYARRRAPTLQQTGPDAGATGSNLSSEEIPLDRARTLRLNSTTD